MFAAALSAALVPSHRVPATVGPARARLTAVRCSEEPSNPPESPESPELTKIGSKAYYKGFLTQPVDETVTAERGDGTEQVLNPSPNPQPQPRLSLRLSLIFSLTLSLSLTLTLTLTLSLTLTGAQVCGELVRRDRHALPRLHGEQWLDIENGLI